MKNRKYQTVRPSTKVLTDVIEWLNIQGITLYSGSADLDTGQREFGLMDIQTAEECVKIYHFNRADGWTDPEH
jgi:hypothetical protein